jgi:hypothetical protein
LLAANLLLDQTLADNLANGPTSPNKNKRHANVVLEGITAMSLPLMPEATAVWLIDNTALTFIQIADFCGMVEREIQGIADGEVAKGVRGFDPISNSQITAEEIARCAANPERKLRLLSPADEMVGLADAVGDSVIYLGIG